MESLPPMAATPKSSWASNAPSRAAMGRPHTWGSPVMRWKYSCKVKWALSTEAPMAVKRLSASTTARYAPR